MRDLDLAAKIASLPDEVWVGSEEVAALTGLSIHTVQQRKIKLPPTDPRIHKMKWLLGDIRDWMANGRLSGQTKSIGVPSRSPKIRKIGES